MSLADYQPRTYALRGADGQPVCTLRGLTTPDIAVLVEHHLPDLEAAFDLFKVARTLEDDEVVSLALPLLQAAPGLMANVIALAAGEPTMAPQAELLPFPMQIEALQQIGAMTFTEAASVKKTMEVVAALLSKGKKMGNMKT